MERILLSERPNWETRAEADGFTYHKTHGGKYWDETRAYRFSMSEVDTIEAVTQELYGMCLGAVEHIIKNPSLMFKLDIPERYHQAIINSWLRHQDSLYGRFDFSYVDGVPKMLEFNADTPTSLYEGSVFQWYWLEDQIKRGVLPKDADQFNSIHEKLIRTFKNFHRSDMAKTFHFAAILESDEDKVTVEYLADCAHQAGYDIYIQDIRDLGVNYGHRVFVDTKDAAVENLFKLYPWEYMFHEEYGPFTLPTKTRIVEPVWKALLSNKGILPILWELYPDHPNLLPAYFLDEYDTIRHSYDMSQNVIKPLLSREGANVSIKTNDVLVETGGEYGHGRQIIQKAAVLPKFGDDYTLIGSWIVGGESAGIGIREDKSPVTANLSRFVPHFIQG